MAAGRPDPDAVAQVLSTIRRATSLALRTTERVRSTVELFRGSCPDVVQAAGPTVDGTMEASRKPGEPSRGGFEVLQGRQLRPTRAMAERHRVTAAGPVGGPVMLFAHGFGCDQQVWAPLIATFADRYRCVAFDTIGSGGSDTSSYDAHDYQSLDGYAADVLGVCGELDLQHVTLVAHSVSAMIAVLAAVEQPDRFAQLVLIAANPYYLDDPSTGYQGGFTPDDLAEVGQALDSNYFTWAEAMAPVIMGVPEAPQLGEQLAASFCRTDPDIARSLIKTSFATDCRPLLPKVVTPTLLLQCRDDAMVPSSVGDHLHRSIRGSQLVRLQARGHCPHISAPAETAAAMTQHLLPRP